MNEKRAIRVISWSFVISLLAIFLSICAFVTTLTVNNRCNQVPLPTPTSIPTTPPTRPTTPPTTPQTTQPPTAATTPPDSERVD